MNIRTTIDPITMREVLNPEAHPCVYDGDGDNGIEICFENEENKRSYLSMEVGERKVVCGDDTDDYVAEG